MDTLFLHLKNATVLFDEPYFNSLSVKGKVHVKNFSQHRYAYINKKIKGKTKTYLVHRLIMESVLNRKLNRSEFVDHKNGDSLDNRINNLRICSIKENSRNRKSKTKGVRLLTSGRYSARITVDGKELYLGSFDTVQEANSAYNLAATKYFGSFASLNEVST